MYVFIMAFVAVVSEVVLPVMFAEEPLACISCFTTALHIARALCLLLNDIRENFGLFCGASLSYIYVEHICHVRAGTRCRMVLISISRQKNILAFSS